MKKHCMITFRSVTPAQRGESVLRSASLSCTLQRTPRWMEEKGCGYCLRLPCTLLPEALMLLRRNTVAFQKVYTVHDNGTVEEWTL